MKLWQKTRVIYLDWPVSLLSTHLLERCSWNLQCSSGYRRARAGTHHTIWQKVLLKSPMIIRVQTSESQDSYLQMVTLFRALDSYVWVQHKLNDRLAIVNIAYFFITCMYRVRLILTRLTILLGFTWTRGCWIVSQPIIADKLQHTIWLIACRDKEC
jgi:hypothetical protein